jgi:hypothetical protein
MIVLVRCAISLAFGHDAFLSLSCGMASRADGPVPHLEVTGLDARLQVWKA